MKRLLWLLPACVLATGCKSPERQLVGSWTTQAHGRSFTMNLREDKTWTEILPTKKPVTVLGTWSLSNGLVTMKVTKFGAATVEQMRRRQAQLRLLPGEQKKVEAINTVLQDNFLTLSKDGKYLKERPTAKTRGGTYTKVTG